MTIEQFQQLIDKYRGIRAIQKFTTDVPDIRFGIQDKYVAAIYQAQHNSIKFTFRVGYTGGLIKNFNAQPVVNAIPHPELKGMFIVTIDNNAFSTEVLELLGEAVQRALNKFFQTY